MNNYNFLNFSLDQLLNIDIKSLPWPQQRELLKQIKLKKNELETQEISLLKQKITFHEQEVKSLKLDISSYKQKTELFVQETKSLKQNIETKKVIKELIIDNTINEETDKEVKSIISNITDNTKFIIVSYFTNDKYKKELQNLLTSINKYGLSYYIEELKDKNNWVLNTHYKPWVIKRALLLFNRPIVFLDADAVIKKYPELFENIKKDIAAYFSESGNLLSGTLYFKNTLESLKLIEMWKNECLINKDVWDQNILKECVQKRRIDIEHLPKCYCQIFDSLKNEVPVIEHYQASRRYRKQTKIDTEKILLLVPSRKRPTNIHRLTKSVYETASYPERVGISFLISNSDTENKKKIKELQKTYPNIFINYEQAKIKADVNLSELWNNLYAENTWSNYVGFYGDDVEFKTGGWDSMIICEFLKNEEMPLMIRTNDSFQKEMAVLFFTNKVLHSALGFYMPDQYKLVCMDQYLSDVCQQVQCYKYLEHVNTYHHAIVLGRADKDETHELRRKGKAHEQVLADMSLYNTDEEKEKRNESIDRLKKYISFIQNKR